MVLTHAPRALLFDVFGTCVEWRKTVADTLNQASHIALNSASASIASRVRLKASDMTIESWGLFAQEWRNSYEKFCKSMADDPSQKWKTVDEHHHDSLVRLLKAWELEGLWNPEEIRSLSLVWHKLEPWADTEEGIQLLNSAFWTCTLSNGNMSLLEDLTAFGNLAFTHIFSAELFRTYKPSPGVYLGAVEKLGVKPQDCAMVAAHLPDLKAAKSCGLQAIYVERPREEDWDAEKVEQARREGWVDIWVPLGEGTRGMVTVAGKLGLVTGSPREMSKGT